MSLFGDFLPGWFCRGHHLSPDLGHDDGERPDLSEHEYLPAQPGEGDGGVRLHVHPVLEALSRHLHGLPLRHAGLQALRQIL